MKVLCPNCLNVFEAEDSEEVVNATASITRKSSVRASWQNIAEEIRSGYGYRVLDLGDVITFTLKNGGTAAVEVVAVNPYWENSMAFAFVDCPKEFQMNDQNTNRGGWHSSKMRRMLNEEFIKLLPDDLLEVIMPRTIIQVLPSNGGKTKYESTDKLWLPSLTEMRGEVRGHSECDFGDVQFPGFNNPKKRVKMFNNDTCWYWLRSPNAGYTANFWIVSYYGGCGNYNANNSNGVCPCFFI